jgi:hypothetical protein
MSGLTFESDTSNEAFRLSLEDWDDVLSMTGDASERAAEYCQLPNEHLWKRDDRVSAVLTSSFPRNTLSLFPISSIVTKPHTLFRCTTLDRLLLLICCTARAEVDDDLLPSVDRLKCLFGSSLCRGEGCILKKEAVSAE